MSHDSNTPKTTNPLLITLVIVPLAIGAFFFGRSTGNGLGVATAPTAFSPSPADAITIPATITRVPTSTPRSTLPPSPTTIPVPSATTIPSPTPIIITDAGVLSRIRSTSILQTTVFKIDTVVRAQKEGSWFFNWGGQKFLMFVKGTVIAGVDLNELNKASVGEKNRTITITLPPAKILEARLDQRTFEDYAGRTLDEINIPLLEDALTKGREQIGITACESEILKIATEDAKKAFEQIISFMKFADYKVTVITTPSGSCSIPVN